MSGGGHSRLSVLRWSGAECEPALRLEDMTMLPNHQRRRMAVNGPMAVGQALGRADSSDKASRLSWLAGFDLSRPPTARNRNQPCARCGHDSGVPVQPIARKVLCESCASTWEGGHKAVRADGPVGDNVVVRRDTL